MRSGGADEGGLVRRTGRAGQGFQARRAAGPGTWARRREGEGPRLRRQPDRHLYAQRRSPARHAIPAHRAASGRCGRHRCGRRWCPQAAHRRAGLAVHGTVATRAWNRSRILRAAVRARGEAARQLQHQRRRLPRRATAHYAVLCDGPVAGRTVLVAGGTGAVGYYAVQIAKQEGARVIATVGSAGKGRIAREAGADEVIDFRAEDVGARIAALTSGNGADRLLEPHFAKNAPLFPKMLAKQGKVIVYGAGGVDGAIPAGWGIQNQPTIKFIYMYELPAQAYVQAIAALERLQSAGKLKHLPVREFGLDQIAQVHEAVENGNSGTRMVIAMA